MIIVKIRLLLKAHTEIFSDKVKFFLVEKAEEPEIKLPTYPNLGNLQFHKAVLADMPNLCPRVRCYFIFLVKKEIFSLPSREMLSVFSKAVC